MLCRSVSHNNAYLAQLHYKLPKLHAPTNSHIPCNPPTSTTSSHQHSQPPKRTLIPKPIHTHTQTPNLSRTYQYPRINPLTLTTPTQPTIGAQPHIYTHAYTTYSLSLSHTHTHTHNPLSHPPARTQPTHNSNPTICAQPHTYTHTYTTNSLSLTHTQPSFAPTSNHQHPPTQATHSPS